MRKESERRAVREIPSLTRACVPWFQPIRGPLKAHRDGAKSPPMGTRASRNRPLTFLTWLVVSACAGRSLTSGDDDGGGAGAVGGADAWNECVNDEDCALTKSSCCEPSEPVAASELLSLRAQYIADYLASHCPARTAARHNSRGPNTTSPGNTSGRCAITALRCPTATARVQSWTSAAQLTPAARPTATACCATERTAAPNVTEAAGYP